MSHLTPPQFQIKNEGLAARCEVCHQTDKFDSESGYCRRCGHLSGEKTISITINQYDRIQHPLEQMTRKNKIFLGGWAVVFLSATIYWQSQWVFGAALLVLITAGVFQQKKKEKIDRCPECGGVFPIGDADREGVYCRYCGVRLRA